MVLAGVLLKIGVYGVYRFLLMWGMDVIIVELVSGISMVGIVVRGVVCVRLSDLKEIVAYSSVVHIGLLLTVIVNMGFGFLTGVVAIVVFHGFVSMELFYLVGELYIWMGSRRLIVVKGVVFTTRMYRIFVFVVLIINIGFPVAGNYIAEVELICYLVWMGVYGVFVSVVYVFLRCVYNILVYVFIVVGRSRKIFILGVYGGAVVLIRLLFSLEFLVAMLVYIFRVSG